MKKNVKKVDKNEELKELKKIKRGIWHVEGALRRA